MVAEKSVVCHKDTPEFREFIGKLDKFLDEFSGKRIEDINQLNVIRDRKLLLKAEAEGLGLEFRFELARAEGRLKTRQN